MPDIDRIRFANVDISLPAGWYDVTDDLPVGTPPTLAKPDGVGALQFSTAKYTAGVRPQVTAEDLLELLADFAQTKGYGPPSSVRTHRGAIEWVHGDFESNADLIRVWYVSDGDSVLFVTYIAELREARLASELREASAIVESVSF